VKEKIRYHAIRLFDKSGFHGTSMRDIADAAGCKTPTVYHHYKSKEDLFDEVVRVAYLNLIGTQRGMLPEIITPQDYCAESGIQKKHLSEDDLLVHRLALKTWLGCEGCEEVRQRLIDWESARHSRNEAMLANTVSSLSWAKIISRVYINLTLRIVLFREDIPDEEIREEIRLVFEAATQNK
jgi:AcrR family transcriptional regulator